MLFQVGSEDCRQLNSIGEFQQSDGLGPALICLTQRPEKGRFQYAFDDMGAEARNLMDDINIGMAEVTAGNVAAMGFLQREL